LLNVALAGVASISVPRWSRAASAIDVVSIANGVSMLTGAGGNVLVRSTDEAQLLVDSGAAEHSDALLSALSGLPGAGRVETLFNTHWHLDQVGSNLALGRSGASIIAHEKTRLRLATDYYLPAEDRFEKALPTEAQPKTGFYTGGQLRFGDEPVEYGYLLEAHTDGDIYVYFRDSNIVAAGDVVSPERDPVLDWFGGGWLGGRVDALALLLDITDDETRFVPSYGPAVGRREVIAEHEMMTVLFERMLELVRKGMGADDILAEGIMDGLGRELDDPIGFVYDAHKGFWAHHNTLSHDVV